ncbi:selenophosphate synthase [Anaerobranca californiensis DSM 14826]|uniref:Selenophosphate synthase n=1 Tax=Anaerobranca californiensis DSM 14826 TaxID=1120989 RepID=A0A1M6QAC1_9FIRM|nr:selenophosphate synthase [Anaerobranca californiensis DSM 14826]
MLVGYQKGDDGAVFLVPQGKAVIQTLDFFTPMVDDPFTFGQITAANAVSDIYAMGGDPQFALNIVAFPICTLPIEILKEILKGAAEKLTEAGVSIIGGHSIDDPTPKYGLSVTGFVDPKKVWKNEGCKEGQDVILTKPLGSGIITTAIKAEMAEKEGIDHAIKVMTTLNKGAKEVLENYPITCCTDITGFGLVGHSIEIASASGIDIYFDYQQIPTITGAEEYASYGLIPGGAYRNREHFQGRVEIGENVPQTIDDIIHDPQTSGGLLFSCDPHLTNDILMEMEKKGIEAKKIGWTTKGSGRIFVK